MLASLNRVVVVVILASVPSAFGQVIVETVTVGNIGNIGQLSGADVVIGGNAMGNGPTRLAGAVNYIYEIGKYEVTAGQYTAFLNAAAADDTYGLFATSMDTGLYSSGIVRQGDPGSYTYTVPPDWADRPIAHVTFGDAVRFANWMHNGQPSGPQNLTTTEDGSYLVNGAMTAGELSAVTRKASATWVIPTDDEWYKAAYHLNDGPTGNYWGFTTQSDSNLFHPLPSNNVIDPDPGDNANFWLQSDSIGAPYWRTVVGEFENSPSVYGTFDQGGNVWEWLESYPNGVPANQRTLRGGSFKTLDGGHPLHAAYRMTLSSSLQRPFNGFRLARVSNDCNGNDVIDSDDLANGTSTDHNNNFAPDECDIAGGTSLDCNHNGIPDEVETGVFAPPDYYWDDGIHELRIGVEDGGDLAWLNRFTVEQGRETVLSVNVVFGNMPAGRPAMVYIWSDPDGDGSPADAGVIASAPTVVANPGTDVYNVVDVPDTFIGPAGTSFFAGVIMHHQTGEFPVSLDITSWQPMRSWLAIDIQGSIDPSNLGSAEFLFTSDQVSIDSTYMVRLSVAPLITPVDCNVNSVPDDCDIASGTSDDTNGDGIPDECPVPCPWDLDGSQVVGITDLLDLLAAWGSTPAGPPDFDGDGTVGIADFLALLANWGECP